jgi:hypothetical protein
MRISRAKWLWAAVLSSAVLVGATVTATNPATGVSFTAKTTTAGTYNIAALPSGSYRVEVGQPGFTTVRTNVVVDVGNVVGLDLRLAPKLIQGNGCVNLIRRCAAHTELVTLNAMFHMAQRGCAPD